jgi:ADP-heptose:LPS heptosyltransferase
MPTLEGVDVVKTNLVEAAKWMAGCRFYVGTEGFLHHLAAAFGKTGVVLFGGYAPPDILGYEHQRNIAVEAPGELGHFTRTGAMHRIPPERVIEAVRGCCRERPLA